jgi:hypothetical protein
LTSPPLSPRSLSRPGSNGGNGSSSNNSSKLHAGDCCRAALAGCVILEVTVIDVLCEVLVYIAAFGSSQQMVTLGRQHCYNNVLVSAHVCMQLLPAAPSSYGNVRGSLTMRWSVWRLLLSLHAHHHSLT